MPTSLTAWPLTSFNFLAARAQSDIMLLADQFAIQMCRELGLPLFPGFSDYAKETLLAYHWPGNIRELKNVVERSVYRHGSSETELDNIIIDPFQRSAPSLPTPASSGDAPTLPLIYASSRTTRRNSCWSKA